MFDIGFSEIVVIAVVALIVIGPEKLPKTARTLGHLFGRLQRYVTEVKADISREIELEELRKMQQEVQSAAKAVEQSVTSAAKEVESGMRGVESELNVPAQEAAGSAESTVEMQPLPAPKVAIESGTAREADAEPPRQPTLPGFDRG